jgi:RNA polymerase sigma-70 factor (sigma-E family)
MVGDVDGRDRRFRDFFEAESEPLRHLALFLTADRNEAADLAQETMARVYRAWGRIHDRDPGPYARRTLVNLVRSQHRRNILRIREREAVGDPITHGHAGRVDDWMTLAKALKMLSPIKRAVVVMRYFEDLPEAEIAQILDRPLGTIKSDLHRALARLRPLLEDEAPAETRMGEAT